jgi:hypothetical protein
VRRVRARAARANSDAVVRPAQVLQQAENRAHRIGQVQDVHIVYVFAKRTVDDIIWCAALTRGRRARVLTRMCGRESVSGKLRVVNDALGAPKNAAAAASAAVSVSEYAETREWCAM